MEFDNLTEEEKAKLWQLWKAMKSKEAKEEQKAATSLVAERTGEKPKPLYKTYWPLGEGQGIAVSVWENNLQLQRRVRDQNGEWKTEQEISLAKPILEKLYIRLPALFEKMKKANENKN
jgi:hypothetical protein